MCYYNTHAYYFTNQKRSHMFSFLNSSKSKNFEEAKKLFDESKKFEDSREFEKALESLEKAKSIEPNNPILKVKHYELREKINGDEDPLKPFRIDNSQ